MVANVFSFLQIQCRTVRATAMEMASVCPGCVTASPDFWEQTVLKVSDVHPPAANGFPGEHPKCLPNKLHWDIYSFYVCCKV